jgi:predicted phosphodiesterase
MRKKKLVIMLFLILLSLALFASSKEISNNGFRKNPYLIFNNNPEDITILWQTKSISESIITISNNNNLIDSVNVSQKTDDHLFSYNFRAENGQKYIYKVVAGEESFSGNFNSCPKNSAENLDFYVYGDTRSYPENHNEVAKAICNDFKQNPNNQTFIISTGDLVKHGNYEKDWDNQFFDGKYKFIVKMLASLPYISAQGNHERNGDIFRKYFPYNRGSKHWSFDYGPVHIVLFNEYEDFSENSVEIKWLKDDLKNTDKKWKILVMHEPGWSAGGHHNNKEVQKMIQPICKEFNVPIVFNGHNHYYARAKVDGIYYITSGGGGAPLYSPNPNYPNVQVAKKTLHFCKVEITGNKMIVKVLSEKSKLVDELEICK